MCICMCILVSSAGGLTVNAVECELGVMGNTGNASSTQKSKLSARMCKERNRKQKVSMVLVCLHLECVILVPSS